MNPVERLVDAVNRRDLAAIEATYHPDFELVVPGAPGRGFVGRDPEVAAWEGFISRFPVDGRLELVRMVETAESVWVENCFTLPGVEMRAIVDFGIDPETQTITRMCYLLSHQRGLSAAD